MGLRVVVEDHAGIEQVLGIEQPLDAAHQVGGLPPPFHFDEGRHVAPGAVLGLERAVVLADHQLADVVHEARVALDFGGVAEILGEHEVQVAFQRVAENDGFRVAVLAQQRLKVERGRRQRLDGEGDVLDDDGGAGAAHGAHRREGALAHLPVHLAGGRVGRERRHLDGNDAGQGAQRRVHALLQQVGVGGTDLDQQGGGIVAQAAHHGRQAGLVLHRAQRRAVEQFDGGHRLGLEADHRLAGRLDVGEEHQGAGLAGIFDHRAVGDARNEAQRAFGPDHQVGQDVDRVFVVDQCVEAVAGGVLDLELVADARGQRLVGARRGAELGQFADQRGMALAEGGDAERVFSVEHGPVGEDHAHSGQRAVAVLRRAAAHAGSIVGGDAADLAGIDRGRVGADLASVRRQAVVHLAADDAGAEAHRGGVGGNLAGGEAFADQRQHAVGDGLAREAGAGGAEGHRPAVGVCRPQQGLHLFLGLDHGDDFRRHAVEAGIGAVGQASQLVGDDLPLGQDAGEGFDQRAHGFLSLIRSRRRFGAGTSGVRLRVHAPWSIGDRARPRLMNHEVMRYIRKRL